MQVREKVGKSRFIAFFQWVVARRLAKAAGAEPCDQMRNWKLQTVGEAHLEVQKLKTPPVRTTFGSCNVEKVDADVARSAFSSLKCQKLTGSDHYWKLRCRKSAPRCGAKHIYASQKCQKLAGSDHFWKFRCRKSARRCGAKHMSKSKGTKHATFSALLEVERLKKWRCCGAKHMFKSKV